MAQTKIVICPYCGASQPAEDCCRSCGGLYDELSRQATHNDMGPWYIRNLKNPYQPGCSYQTLVRMIERDQIDRYTILRGPTTKQFWTVARRIPGVSHLLGYCHNCDQNVSSEDHGCSSCGVPFGAYLDRNHMGLPDISPLPWEADVDTQEMTASTGASSSSSPAASTRWSTTGEARGISSFASDDEIVSNGRGPDGRGAVQQTPVSNIVDAAHGMGDIGSSTSRDAAPQDRDAQSETHNTRALRREIARQRRFVTTLTVLVVIAFILILVSNIDRMTDSSSEDSGANNTMAAPAASNVTGTDTDDASVQPAGRNEDASPDRSYDVTDPGVGDPQDTEPAPSRFEQAQSLITKAQDADLAIPDRIKAYEQALERLQALKEELPESDRPEDLVELIDSSARELEKLRLREFFP